MRKWLIILLVLIGLIAGALWWLGNSLEKHKPEAGKVEVEIDHVF